MNESVNPPARHEVEAIIALEGQPVLRNLRITQCYHDLSAAMAAQVGEANVNWCTFASWASKTAGRFVRGEVAAMFRDALQSDVRLAGKLDRINRLLRRGGASTRVNQSVVFDALSAPVEEVSRHITAGNLAVFAELGPMFSLMCSRFGQDRTYDAGAMARLPDELALTVGAPERGGQSLLRSAVRNFYRAKFESQIDRKAERLLLANAQTGLHEQIRLQPAIAGALQLPPEIVLRSLLDRCIGPRVSEGARKRWRDVLQNAAKLLFAELGQELRRIWRLCASRALMTLRLPDGEIHLGEDLKPAPGRPLFPPALLTIASDELREMLARYRADGSTADQSGAKDWADIPERMHFILTLFRGRQQDQRLFEQPFSAAQRRDIDQGRMPRGAL